jgi:arginyl-tRNA synthetase
MATCTASGLDNLLKNAGLQTPVPEFPGADLLHNPQDILRAYLAETVGGLTGCDRLVAYEAIQPSNVTGMGDLVLVTPRLKLKDSKPKELVKEIAFQVRHRLALSFCLCLIPCVIAPEDRG